jgi:hypothetical protein
LTASPCGGTRPMSEPAQSPRLPVVEIATDADLWQGLKDMLRKEGYNVTERASSDTLFDFEVYKPEDPEHTRVIIMVAAAGADEGTIGRALAGLGWYRQQHHPDARAWVIAKEFTAEAWFAAQVCRELTLKWYRVALSTVDATGWTVHRDTSV